MLCGTDDAIQGQPADSEDDAVLGGSGGKVGGSSAHESRAGGIKRAEAFEESNAIGMDTDEADLGSDDAKRTFPILQQVLEVL